MHTDIQIPYETPVSSGLIPYDQTELKVSLKDVRRGLDQLCTIVAKSIRR